MKKVAICQSNYLPWKGYFDLIHDVEVFVFYDDVQFTVRDWRNRNKIKTPQGGLWVTVPVGADRNRRICEVTIPDDGWQKHHWKTIRQFYSKAPHFKQYQDFFEHVYLEVRWRTLSELNQFLIMHIAREFLGIKIEFIQSAHFEVTSKKQERILDLLHAVGADVYVSGPSAKAYLDSARFGRAGIDLIWKDYSGYPEYSQFHPPFEHAVSILDLLFHMGEDASYFIWGWRSANRQTMKETGSGARL